MTAYVALLRGVNLVGKSTLRMSDLAVVRANPFTDLPGNRVQAFFMNDPPPADLLATVRNKADDERIATGPREVFVAYGETGIGKSRLRIPAAESGTARNMNTVAKLAELLKGMP